MEKRKSAYIQDLHQQFVTRAIAHGTSEQGAAELADFMVDKVDFSFRNGIKFAKERGWASEREQVAA